MEKEYTIEILSVGEKIEGLKPSPILFKVDKEKFNNMLLLVDFVTSLLCEAEFLLDNQESQETASLRVFAGEDVLFDSVKSFDEYQKKHKIQAWMDSDFSTYITVNDIRFRGQVEDGMITN